MKTALFILSCSILIIAGEDCRFPASWHGLWKIQQYRRIGTIEITSTSINGTGRCVKVEREKYLLSRPGEEEHGQPTTCYTCMIFTPQHVNVIQFKSGTTCVRFGEQVEMNIICSHDEVGPNGNLKTIVRADAVPVSCPDHYKLSVRFIYSASSGYCTEEGAEISTMQRCASESRMMLKFASCPRLGYESFEYELVCLATWRNAGYWLFAKLGSNDYRCMYYDMTSDGFSISENADCTGLSLSYTAPISISWIDGTQLYKPAAMCMYPSWFTDKEWLDLSGNNIYRYDQSAYQMVVDTGSPAETSLRLTCHQKDDSNQYITEVINGCDHGYQCVTLQPITESVTRITIGQLSRTPAAACSQRKTRSSVSYTTLVRHYGASPEACPVKGQYSFGSTGGRCTSVAEVPCRYPSTITLSACGNTNETFSCSASWSEGGVERLILSETRIPHRSNCFKYENNGDEKIFSVDEGCNYGSPLISRSTQDAQIKLYNHNRLCPGEKDDQKIYDESTNMALTSGCQLRVSNNLFSSLLPILLLKSYLS